jgi:hypothetical protein
VESDHTGLNFAYLQWFDGKIRKSSPNSLYKCGQSFSVNSGICIGTTVYSVFCESADKSGGIATVPEILVPYPPDRMKMWPVSARVNSPNNKDAEIILPIELQ